jgi:hypothetical protein
VAVDGLPVRLPGETQRGFPSPEEDVLGRVCRELAPEGRAIPPGLRLLVESIALPFHSNAFDPTRRSPTFLPIYWHAHLRETGHEDEASELLSLMDAVAAPLRADEEPGWDPQWTMLEGAVALATRHVRRQAGVQAAAARKALLPSGWYSHLPGTEPDPAWTPAVRGAFEAIGSKWPDVKGWPYN